MPVLSNKVLCFGDFNLDPTRASVSGPDGILPLRPKAFDVLLHLAERPNRVVSKDELLQAIWPNVFVTENSLVQCISDIRAALRDDNQTILKTVARRGYIFVAPLVELDPSQEPHSTPTNSVPLAPLPSDRIPTVNTSAMLAAFVTMGNSAPRFQCAFNNSVFNRIVPCPVDQRAMDITAA